VINRSFEDGDSTMGIGRLEITDDNGAEQLVMGLEPNIVYRLSVVATLRWFEASGARYGSGMDVDGALSYLGARLG